MEYEKKGCGLPAREAALIGTAFRLLLRGLALVLKWKVTASLGNKGRLMCHNALKSEVRP